MFAKAPVPGEVKTRLAPALGNRGAAIVYRSMLWSLLRRLADERLCPLQLWCSPTPKHPFFAACRRAFGVSLHRQCGVDLGERMLYGFRAVLDGNTEGAVLIGADCPQLTAAHCAEALARLQRGDHAVLGPTIDGGYVLIGLRHAHATVFRRLRWGQSDVARRTCARFDRLHWRWFELERLTDIDRPQDLRGSGLRVFGAPMTTRRSCRRP